MVFFGFNSSWISRRHSGKANVLFADGHVGSETPPQLFYPSFEILGVEITTIKSIGETMSAAEDWNPSTP